jgi:hypothetical protein
MELNGPAMSNFPSVWLATLVIVPVRLVVPTGSARLIVSAADRKMAMSANGILQGNFDIGGKFAQ